MRKAGSQTSDTHVEIVSCTGNDLQLAVSADIVLAITKLAKFTSICFSLRVNIVGLGLESIIKKLPSLAPSKEIAATLE